MHVGMLISSREFGFEMYKCATFQSTLDWIVVQLGSFVMETMWICDVYSGFACLVGCGKFDN
jgi:cytochrome b subunit of formate dehydrogenase